MNLHVFKMDTWQYLLCFKSDFDAVKSKVSTPLKYVPLFVYLRYFKSNFDAVKSKFGQLIK